jgi:hypothetical protein
MEGIYESPNKKAIIIENIIAENIHRTFDGRSERRLGGDGKGADDVRCAYESCRVQKKTCA